MFLLQHSLLQHSVSTILSMHLFMGILARVFEACGRALLAGWRHGDVTIWRFVEICAFKKVKHRKSWLVQLATGTKRKVSEVVEKCPLVMDGLVTCVDLNVLPLGSYDVLIGMDWLEAHRVKLDCYNKTFECMNEEGNLIVVQGIPKVILVQQVSAM